MDNSKGKNEGKDDQLGNLSSNPKHILEDSAKEKTAKHTWDGAACQAHADSWGNLHVSVSI